MRKNKQSWINTNNIYIYLLLKSLLAFFVLLVSQIFFYFYNTRIFHVNGLYEWLGIAWGNITFGLATLGCILMPYYALNLIPFKFRWNNHFHNTTEIVLYYLPVGAILVANICDTAYYQFTYRRMSGEIFQYLGIGGNMGALWPKFVIDYWQATLFALVIFAVLFWLGTKIHLIDRNKHNKHVLNDILGTIIGTCCIIFLFRGGFGKNLEWRDTTKYCQAKNCALVTNSGYNVVRTLFGGTLDEEHFMNADKAKALFDPCFTPICSDHINIDPWTGWAAGAGWCPSDCYFDSISHKIVSLGEPRRKNVVVIVLESFSQEYMGCYNNGIMPSFTPFLDSLSQHAVVYQGRSNGKKSIEGIPAIFASVPTLMTFPLTLSDYKQNDLRALPTILHENGYHTAFFHGSYNGVMSFDNLCAKMGFEEYYGMDEYNADRFAKEKDYDGCWGIYDEIFLQYIVRKMSSFQQPFMTGVFTISSHHPYTMQPGYENQFAEGPHPLCRMVMYSDNALRKFFDAARQTEWYKNTIFVITADHPGQGLHHKYNDYNGWYRIPMMFYLPDHEEFYAIQNGKQWSTHKEYSRIMQQTDIMPTLLDYLDIRTQAVCFGTSAFRNPNGWQIAYGNGYYQLESKEGIAVLGQQKEEGNGNMDLLKSVVQQYNYRMIHNLLATTK